MLTMETKAIEMARKALKEFRTPERAEAHTNWNLPVFDSPAFALQYCKALYGQR